MKKLLLVLVLLAAAAPAFGQGFGFTGSPVINGVGQPIAGASVAITSTNPCGTSPTYVNCNGSAQGRYRGTTPPAGLVTLYTDITAATPTTNPLTTDPFGNWTAYTATGGTFWITVYGTRIAAQVSLFTVSGNGACGGNCIVTLPSGNQTVSQPFVAGSRTTLAVNDFNQVVYVTPDFNWAQTNNTALTAAAPATITLAPCPKGVLSTLTSKNVTMWISGVGTPEMVTLTASTCTSDAASGTVSFTPANSHAGGYTIGSNTAGIEEAVNYAYSLFTGSSSTSVASAGTVIVPPHLDPTINGTVYIQASTTTVDFSGNVLQCATGSVACVFVGNPANTNSYIKTTVKNLRLRAMASELTGIEVQAQGTVLDNIGDIAVGFTGTFWPAFIQGDNDQNFVVHNVNIAASSGANVVCTSPVHCTAGILMSGSPSFGILHASDLNMNRVNCIDNLGQNSMTVSGNFICQNIPMFMLRSTSQFPENENLVMDGGYIEGCLNSTGLGCAGFILKGGVSKIGVGNYVSFIPSFGATGATRYMYWVVPIDGSGNKGNPLLAGTATLAATGTYTVKWYGISPGGSYDILRQAASGAGAAPTTATFTGGSVAAGGSIVTALSDASACDPATLICTYIDDISLPSTAYTVPTIVFGPKIDFWPAIAVAAPNVATTTATNNAKVQFDTLPGNDILHGGLVSAFGALGHTPFSALRCLGGGNDWTLIGVACPSNLGNGALWVRAGSSGLASVQGAINFSPPPGFPTGSLDILTFKSADPQLTFATPLLRPAWQAGDSATGYETASSGGLYQRDSNSLRWYIGKVPDNAPQMKLTSNSLALTPTIDIANGALYQESGHEVVKPASPAAGFEKAYFKAASGLCSVDSAGTEYCPGAVGAKIWQGCNGKGLGDGLNAIAAGTYLQYSCVNTTGATVTMSSLRCWTDNNGTSTMAAANNAGTALLTGPVTCTNTKASGGAAGTQSATVTLAAGDAISFTFVADGTSKQTNWTIFGTY